MSHGGMTGMHGESIPDKKMGRSVETSTSVKKAEKKRANTKRRQRDKRMSESE